jgi:DNA-binding MarR family transcriptional regulator
MSESPSRETTTVAAVSTSLEPLLDQGSDRRFREVIQWLFGFAARMTALRGIIGGMVGLTGPQYSMLISVAHLNASGRDVSVSTLAESLCVSGTYVTAESKKLERLGLLRRDSNPRDRRGVLLSLDAKGQALIDDVLPALRGINDIAFGSLSRIGFEVLHAELPKLVESADAALLVAAAEGRQRQLRRM